MDERIYLDYNATTPCLPEVEEAFRRFALEEFGNPSSAHFYGKRAKEWLEKFRAQVAEFVGAESEEIIFTSGGTESNHLAIFGILWERLWERREGHLLVSAFEHPSVLKPAVRLLEMGFFVDFVPVSPEGYVDPDEVKKRLKKNTVLVSIMLANNEIGTIQPVKEIARICREREILFHTDACQAVGKIPVNVKEIDCDLMSFAGHKMYAPKGIGALFVRKGVKLSPLFLGGGQERGLRAGTEPLALIAALAKACEIAGSDLEEEVERQKFLKNKFLKGLQEIYPDLVVYGRPEATLPNTLTVSFKGLDAGELLARCPSICASTGAACHDRKGSTTLIAMGVPEELAKGTIRFSIGRFTNLFHIEKALSVLKGAIFSA